MELLEITPALYKESPLMLISILLFVGLMLYFLIKFFSFFFDFIQAKGCLTVGLISLVGLPGIIVLSIVAGYTITSALLILAAVIGLATGYIARDSEGTVGKFGLFIMIVSAMTLILALFISKLQGLF